MKRHLLNLMTGLSLALALAVALLWARSYRQWESFGRATFRVDPPSYAHQTLSSTGGRIWFDAGWGPLDERGAQLLEEESRRVRAETGRARGTWGYGSNPPHHPQAALDRAGFHFFLTRMPRPGGRVASELSAGMPHALPLALAAALPAVRATTWLRRHRRARRGACRACGYDLRATPGRCPECGEGAGRGTAG